MMIKFNELKEGQKIKYLGNSLAYGGTYKLCRYETTFVNPEECPEEERDSLIIHVESGDYFIFYLIRFLEPEEWELVE